MTDRIPLALDVVIDVVCPWCFVGKRRLDAALKRMPEIDAHVAYRPFQLDPTLPPEGMDRTAYMLGKFGDQARIDAAHASLTEMGRELGILFRFDEIRIAPNTLDAHRLLRWAGAVGKGDEAAEQLFSLYFEAGADLTKAETLIAAGAAIGLDPGDVAARLADGTDRDAVTAEIAFANRIGITGVPCTIVANRFAISGAQPPEVLVDAIRRVAAERPQGA